MSERQSAPSLGSARPWMRFSNGTPCPALAWGSPFRHAFEVHKDNHGLDGEAGLVVVAMGAHPDNLTHLSFGRAEPLQVVSALGELAHRAEHEPLAGAEVFRGAYKGLSETRPGESLGVTLGMMGAGELQVAHFGPISQEEVATALLPYTREVMERLGVEIAPITPP